MNQSGSRFVFFHWFPREDAGILFLLSPWYFVSDYGPVSGAEVQAEVGYGFSGKRKLKL